jgi:hypothetical protein
LGQTTFHTYKPCMCVYVINIETYYEVHVIAQTQNKQSRADLILIFARTVTVGFGSRQDSRTNFSSFQDDLCSSRTWSSSATFVAPKFSTHTALT